MRNMRAGLLAGLACAGLWSANAGAEELPESLHLLLDQAADAVAAGGGCTLPEAVLPWVPLDTGLETVQAPLPGITWLPGRHATGLPGVVVAEFSDAESISRETSGLLVPAPVPEASVPAVREATGADAALSADLSPAVSVPVEPLPSKPVAKTPSPAKPSSPVPVSGTRVKDPVPSPALKRSREREADDKSLARTPVSREVRAEPADTRVVVPAPSPAPLAPKPSGEQPARTVQGLRGSIVEVAMDGRGWVYTGDTADSRSFTFLGKKSGPKGDVFRFRILADGVFPLAFSRQDLMTGILESGTVSLVGGARIPASVSPSVSARDAPAPAVTVAPVSPVQPARVLPSAPDAASGGTGSASLADLQALLDAGSEAPDGILFAMAGLYADDASCRDIDKAYELYVRIQKEHARGPWAVRARDRALYLKRTFGL